MDVLLLAHPNDQWPHRVERLISGRLAVHIADVQTHPEPHIDCTDVRLIVGSPSSIARWIPACPNVEWIQSTWAGVDALVDTLPDGVVLTPLKHVFGQSMSEFVLGWILALERRVIERAGATHWDDRPELGVLGKRMGILGTGSIGSAVANAAHQFGIECRGMNSNGRPIPGFTHCFKSNDMAFFDGLDYLVSVLPKTSATDNIINSDSLKRLAPNSLVVNIGRGNAVDDGALLHAIRQGYVRAAVLDVFREEPLPQSDPYWHEPNVFVTSHTSAPTSERLVSEAMATNLERFLVGQQPLGAFEQHKGY